MRDLLFLSHRIPYPPSKGDKIRAWHFLQHFAATRRVHLGCFVDDERDWEHVPFLQRQLGGETFFAKLDRRRALVRSLPALVTGEALTLPYYRDAQLAAWVDRLRRTRPMTVFAYSSSMAQYVMEDLGTSRVIDFVDVDSEKWREYATRRTWPLSAIYRREANALLAAERRIAAEFDAAIFVSEAEARVFRERAPETAGRVSSVTIGVDAQRFSPEVEHPNPYSQSGHPALCFTGMMDYWPNIDAVTWFAESVLPAVRRTHPRTTFWIVGANPTRAVQSLASHPGVYVTGRVEDTRPYLAHAAAVVAPLRVARGIQSKVLEAMAMGRPVVASFQAFEGLLVEPGRDLLVARTAEEFAEAINRLWEPGIGEALGRQGREAVQRRHDWAQSLTALDAVIASVEAGRAGQGTQPVWDLTVLKSARG